MFTLLRAIVVLAALLCPASYLTYAQSCPVKRTPKRVDSAYDNGIEPSSKQPIVGTVIFHQDLWDWFSFRAEKPLCGQTEFEFMSFSASPRSFRKELEALRNCHKTTVTGTLFFPSDGEKAGALRLQPETIVADPSCRRLPELLHSDQLQPRADVTRYRVIATVTLAGKESVRFSVRSGSRQLAPWQAYVTRPFEHNSYFASCGTGFLVTDVSSKPEAASQSFVNIDLDIFPFSGKTPTIIVRYGCKRVAPN